MPIFALDGHFLILRSIQAQTPPERPMCTQQANGIELRSYAICACGTQNNNSIIIICIRKKVEYESKTHEWMKPELDLKELRN